MYAQRNDAEDEVSQLPCMPPALWLLLLTLPLTGRVDVDVGAAATWVSGRMQGGEEEKEG